MRDDVLTTYPNVIPDHVHLIHNGIHAEVYKPARPDAALTKLGVDPSAPFALFAGRATRQKGLHLLLAAANEIDPSYQLLIGSRSPETPDAGADVAALA